MYKLLLALILVSFVVNGHGDEPHTSPMLGDSLNRTITIAEEERIGRNIYKTLQKNNNIINDVFVSDYITYIGNKLSRNTSFNRNYVFFVTRSKTVNAFALPGGYIGFNSGLITLTQNEAQLAGVVAHELAHVVLRHSAEMMARSNVNSIPMWIGIFAGLLAGQTEASIASIKSGIGLSVQQNINLVRENEIEADIFAARLMQNSNYALIEMAKFFRLMQGDANSQSYLNEYFMTHPLYSNRISTITNKGRQQSRPIINSTNDYEYIKNILMSSEKNLQALDKKANNSSMINHRLALNYFKAGDYDKARQTIQENYDSNNYNIYISSLMADIHWSMGEKIESRNIIKKLLEIYPDNNAINFQLLKQNIKDSIDLDKSVAKLKDFSKKNNNNPTMYKLLAEGSEKIGDKYGTKLALINFYNLKGNLNMAYRVIDDGVKSNYLTDRQKKNLLSIKNRILCNSNPPIEPVFGPKTCN